MTWIKQIKDRDVIETKNTIREDETSKYFHNCLRWLWCTGVFIGEDVNIKCKDDTTKGSHWGVLNEGKGGKSHDHVTTTANTASGEQTACMNMQMLYSFHILKKLKK